ncbi:FecR family protein [Dyadobacter sp. CY343]|uniref:FecR family protein n=1 Tax=Dyadobacter sp. CY343 TaxID=2907299 RepID=UPI001F243991|nr:FecR domain-containing protein [Dyadobacter sp. CY343]MCE7063254.1 FecR domain-containing protein [Dyadobacter sp. CY343]
MKQELDRPIDDLLVKSLLDEATVAEQMEINQWLSDSDDNLRYFEHFELIWQQSKELEIRSIVDENAAWKRFKDRVNFPQEKENLVSMYQKPVFNQFRVAATILLAVCTGWLAYLLVGNQLGNEQITISSGEQTLTDTLPDGSVVVLNRRSTISYPEHFTGAKRSVALTGEAFFDVTPDKAKPFIISVNDVTVRVVGTSFNVKNSIEKTEVVVETGLVEVARDTQMIKVKPKEKATASRVAGGLTKQKSQDEFYKYYRTNRLICEDTPLWRLVEILNEAYEAEIVIENERIRNLPINTTFEQKSLENIIAVISETFSITAEQDGKRIILK